MSLHFENEVVLQIENLAVRYRQREILSGVSLTVAAGEIVALLGANGAGKSTLLKSAIGAAPRRGGRVLLHGQDIGDRTTHEVARMGVGYLMQGSSIFPNLTVLEHLQMATVAPGAGPLDKVVPLIWKTFPSLDSRRNRRAGLLSGGERQMLSFSMLLSRSAKLWLLDEPSGGLAPQMVRSLMDTIRRLSKELGIAVLLVEQNVKEALRVADKSYVLRNGVIKREVFLEENGSYAEMGKAIFA